MINRSSKRLPVKNRRQNIRKSGSNRTSILTTCMQALKIVTLISVLSLLLAIGIYYPGIAFNQLLQRPIAHIEVEGDLSYLAREQVVGLIGGDSQQGFISGDLREIQQQLQANPWIDRADLRRRWPDTLVIAIVEQRPIARWGTQGFVNYRGEQISVAEAKVLRTLPLLRGEDHQSFAVMKQYQLLSRLLGRYRLELSELEKSRPGVWTLYLNNGWKLIAGRSEVITKTQQFMTLVAANKIDRPADIAVVDMRYSNGLAVRWKTGGQITTRAGGS